MKDEARGASRLRALFALTVVRYQGPSAAFNMRTVESVSARSIASWL